MRIPFYTPLAIASLSLLLSACSESFTDPRDGQSYDIVKIGNITWMAENLNYATEASACPDGDSRNCKRLGRLYTWADAKTVCPEGWRLFTWDDYEIVSEYEDKFDDGVKGLRSTYGFRGTNQSGFSLTGAGIRKISGKFGNIEDAFFWYFPEEDEYDVSYYVHTGYISSTGHFPTKDDGDVKIQGRSVRCVKLE